MLKSILSVACIIVSAANIGDAAGLDTFLTAKMQEYPTWLKQKNLDPYAMENKLSLKMHIYPKLNFEIRNLKMSQFSTPASKVLVEKEGKNSVVITRNAPLTFTGDYTVSGQVSRGTNKWAPFNRQGKFLATYNNNPTQHEDYFVIENIVAKNGHFTLESPTISEYTNAAVENQLSYVFDNWAYPTSPRKDSESDRIWIEAARAFQLYALRLDSPKHPSASFYKQFLQEKFDKTPSSEIESWQ